MRGLCKNGHDRDSTGVNKRGECKICVSNQKKTERARHPEKNRERTTRWYQANRARQSTASRQKRYGVSEGQFRAMCDAQAGLCAICCEPMRPGKETHVDHDHVTGAVRGLLCHHCNVGVGMFKDDSVRLNSAVAYLGVA